VTGGIGHERRADNAGPAHRVPDSVAVVSSVPAVAGYGRPRWWQRLRSALGLGGLVVFGGVLVAAAVAATLLALAILVATTFG
jgi:hypothetical protein